METGIVPKEKNAVLGIGVLSLLGLLIMIFVITMIAKVPYMELLSNIGSFVTGHLSAVVNGGEENLLTKTTNILAVILIGILISTIISTVLKRGKTASSYDLEALQKILDRGPFFVFLVVMAEELVTRGLFLGVFANSLAVR